MSDSLGGKNMGRRVAGAGSSPARSILWNRLRLFDRQINQLDKRMMLGNLYPTFRDSNWLRQNKERIKADAKRKQIRWELKCKGAKEGGMT